MTTLELTDNWAGPQSMLVGHWLAVNCDDNRTGWPHSKWKNSLNFPGFSRAVNLLFHRLSQQNVNVIMTFIEGHSTSTCYRIVPSIFSWHYLAGSLLPQILMILFTQSTAVLHKHLNAGWRTKSTLLQFFPDVAQNSLSFPWSEKTESIPCLWTPCSNFAVMMSCV